MGNCLKCFQSSAEPTLPTTSASPNSAVNNIHSQNHSLDNCYETVVGHHHHLHHNNHQQHPNANERCARETDELLSSRTPLKPAKANNCDTKRNSFKSLGLLNGSAPTMSDIITTVKESLEVSHQTLNKLFEIYKDPDDDELILTDGIERLCNDLNYQPDDFAILVLAWCLDASQMYRFTKTEFIDGLHKMRADNIANIRLRLEQTIEMLKVDAEMFKQLYRFTFRFGLEPDQRVLPLEMAIDLWKLVFTVQTPDLFTNWINFLEKHPNIRRIPKDTWNMYLNFTEQCDIENYDDTEAWPSLFDDFVDYEKTRALELTLSGIHHHHEQHQQQQQQQNHHHQYHHDDDNNNDDPLMQSHVKDGLAGGDLRHHVS
ncbi:DCN1-like protein 3 isoform X2 [Drosophila willistoni]|uniref:DCN1-like protein 3 isoform X2 n=1 Tax=Drosophila willistoni TaxID=7260 RepID=UPI000C26CF6C|nr:DCN1-like protein 3 isoform X2 [Drosophila willistoni]